MTATFDRLERGAKVRCSVCGRTGYQSGTWMRKCQAGHPFRCFCDRAFSTASGLAAHIRRTPDTGPHYRIEESA